MKRLLSLLLTAGVTLLSVACGGGGDIESPYSEAQIGDVVQFGGYDWRVLDIKDSKALILSDKILLTGQQYHDKDTGITWENCSLRAYLNGTFYKDKFSDDEKKLIAETKISNKDNQWYGTSGGNDTKDKIFLLSLEEVVKYFGDSGQLADRPDAKWSVRGVDNISDEYNSNRSAKVVRNDGADMWWLRSPGDDSESAVSVVLGMIYVKGYGGGVTRKSGVRPALWLKL